MNKYEITKKIELFAPPETQESWDCSGWGVDINRYNEIQKIMLCLTITNDVIQQAKEQNCDLIISHHPCFYIPLEWSDINIYSAHTNFDKAKGGTTDILIENLGLTPFKKDIDHEFLRIVDYCTDVYEFSSIIKTVSPKARIVNNKNIYEFNRIAFCAGSGSEFIKDAQELGADCLVTGDIKFHTALDSQIALYDIGHFESEIICLAAFEKLIKNDAEIVYAQEQTPFCQI